MTRPQAELTALTRRMESTLTGKVSPAEHLLADLRALQAFAGAPVVVRLGGAVGALLSVHGPHSSITAINAAPDAPAGGPSRAFLALVRPCSTP